MHRILFCSLGSMTTRKSQRFALAPSTGYFRQSEGMESQTHVGEQYGELAEWAIAPVLKTGEGKTSVGSNPTLAA